MNDSKPIPEAKGIPATANTEDVLNSHLGAASAVKAGPTSEATSIFRHYANWWIVRFFSETKATDWGIVILTAGLLIVGFWQWQVISGQLAEMKSAGQQTDSLIEQYKVQGAALNRLVDAENRYAKAAETADRAWIGIAFVPPDDIERPSRIVINATNSGRGAAVINNFSSEEAGFARFPEAPTYKPTDIPNSKASRFLVVPGMSEPSYFQGIVVNPQQMDVLKSGKITLYLYSKVEYTDLRTNTSHFTHGCMYYVPVVKAFRNCPEYNSAD